ncbi:MAG: anhydro-N-acetylmuramic acid kinase [Gallionella sp.]|nr:anhydro-N-acetylmuramic acid kinase [Gallionella sp.]
MPAAEWYVGLMSGTSLDGVDAALVDFSAATPRLTAKHFLPFTTELRHELLALNQSVPDELHRCMIAANQLAKCYAKATQTLLAKAGVSAQAVRAIGCHGQTLRHRPESAYTVQIGNAAMLAELSGITVISDFRSRDIAAGGQGAPLVPAFHDRILRHPEIHRVIVNIGGIANLTDLPPNGPVSGFDCGPGNLLLDAWCQRYCGLAFDEDGRWAAGGKVLPALLARLQAEPFFALPPPKSTGRDLFNPDWLQDRLEGGEASADVQATLLELTCRGIADAICRHAPGAAEIYLCGGGARNTALRERLAALLPECVVETTAALGTDPDFLEALAFAWLARQALLGQPGNLPAVTGARHFCVLGAIHPA